MQRRNISFGAKAVGLACLMVLLIAAGRWALAQEGSHGPSAEEQARFGAAARADYESRYGPPAEMGSGEGVVGPPPEETPGKLPQVVRDTVPEAQLIQLYCVMMQWKTLPFFAAMAAIREVLPPVITQAKELGMSLEMPDTDAVVSEGRQRLDAACAAKSLDEAERLAEEFRTWGRDVGENQMGQVRRAMQDQGKKIGDEMRQQIQDTIAPLIVEEEAKIKADLEAQAQSLAAAKTAQWEGRTSAPSQGELDAARAEIESEMRRRAADRTAEAEAVIQSRVDAVIGAKKTKMEAFGELSKNIGPDIAARIKARTDYEEPSYRERAINLRRDVIMSAFDQQLNVGMEKLSAASQDIEAARQADPTLPTASQIEAELRADRDRLAAELGDLIEKGDEAAITARITAFRDKWDNYRAKAEASATAGLVKGCAAAIEQFGQAKPQIAAGIERINKTLDNCAGRTDEECLKVNEFAPRLNALGGRLENMGASIAVAEQMCQDPMKADKQELIAFLKGVQDQADAVKLYGQALEADKIKAIADSVGAACAQALPPLRAGQQEVAVADLAQLQRAVERCRSKQTESCREVNANLKPAYDQMVKAVKTFNDGVAEAEKICQAPDESNFDRLRDLLGQLRSQGDDLQAQAKELKLLSQVIERPNAAQVCAAATENFGVMRRELAAGMQRLNDAMKGCPGPCVLPPEIMAKKQDLDLRTQDLLARVSGLEGRCREAGTGEIEDSLIDEMEGLKTEAEALRDDWVVLRQEFEELQRQSEGEGASIYIEAEAESASNVIWANRPATNTKEINPRWRPPYYGIGVWYLANGGEWLRYDFDVTVGGNYKVWIRDYVDKFQARGIRRVIVKFDGKTYGTFPETTAPSEGPKGTLAWHRVGDGVNLSPGKHQLLVQKEALTAGAAILDVFYLVTGDAIPPEK